MSEAAAFLRPRFPFEHLAILAANINPRLGVSRRRGSVVDYNLCSISLPDYETVNSAKLALCPSLSQRVVSPWLAESEPYRAKSWSLR
ncbi:hypothetical protein EMIT0P228_20610 [Pseudomonas brassicacearum]